MLYKLMLEKFNFLPNLFNIDFRSIIPSYLEMFSQCKHCAHALFTRHRSAHTHTHRSEFHRGREEMNIRAGGGIFTRQSSEKWMVENRSNGGNRVSFRSPRRVDEGAPSSSSYFNKANGIGLAEVAYIFP